MAESLLEARSLSCERDDRLLFSDLNLHIKAGQIWQIKGPNGAGKTTLLRILCGLYQDYRGQVLWQGSDVFDVRAEFNSDLLYLGHKPAITQSMTPYENLRYLTGLRQAAEDEALFTALESVGLAGYEHVDCQNLSAGQLRRVGLARLYLSNAKLWVLDEVFTAIDLEGVAALEHFFEQKASEQQVAVILTTHHQPKIHGLNVFSLQGAPRV